MMKKLYFFNSNVNRLKSLLKKITKRSKGKIFENTSNDRVFDDFEGFLASSYTQPVIHAPFREEDKRCFATMENIAQYLTQQIPKEKQPLISVIMPTHNRQTIIQTAINSVLKQKYKNFELIIIDDGSTDNTTKTVKKIKDPRIKLLQNKKCQGVSHARNKGLKNAKGQYIAYLDSDNTWDPRYLAAMIGAFQKLPDADAIYGGQLLYRGEQKNPFAIRYGSYNKSLLQNRNYIDLNTFCHKKEVYTKLGGFDENLKRYVDWDYILHIAETSQIYSIPILLSHYYYDKAPNTITNNPQLNIHLKQLRQKQEKRKKNHTKSLKNTEIEKNVSTIIPSYESLEDLKECIKSLLKPKREWLEIIVIDNNSSKSVIEYLKNLETENKIKLILNKTNYGFTYAVNQGIEISKPKNDILILNNDAIITPKSIETLQEKAYQLPECGIIVPQQVLPAGTPTITTHVPYANPDYECDVNPSAHHKNIINPPLFHSGKILELSFAPFFCTYIKRTTLNQSLGLDPEYGRHYRSDRIYCNYIRHIMKQKIYHTSEAIVYHKLQKSTNQLKKENQTTEYKTIFIKNQWTKEQRKKLNYQKAPWDT